MSLFKTKELWSVENLHNNESFSASSLAFFPSTDLITNSAYTDLIFTASLEGFLRLFHVVPNASEEQLDNAAKASNLLLEVNLNQPILQIEVGNLST